MELVESLGSGIPVFCGHTVKIASSLRITYPHNFAYKCARWHPVDSCLKKVSIILTNSQAELVGSFVLNHQEFLYSSIADTFDSSKMWDMSHFSE